MAIAAAGPEASENTRICVQVFQHKIIGPLDDLTHLLRHGHLGRCGWVYKNGPCPREYSSATNIGGEHSEETLAEIGMAGDDKRRHAEQVGAPT